MERTKYKAVVETLRREIFSGKWSSLGNQFPSERALARRFGVSRPTISMALQELCGQGYLSRKQGKVTSLTRNARKNSGMIAAIVPSFPKVEIFPIVCRELSRICQENGRMFACVDEGEISTKGACESLRSIAKHLIEQNVSGVIFRPIDYFEDSPDINREILSIFRSLEIPVVLIDCDVGDLDAVCGFDLVGVDNMKVGALLGRHVVERGARRIVYVYRARSSVNVDQRMLGIRSALENGDGAQLVGMCQQSEDDMGWLNHLRRMKPDAILCSGDIVAAKVLNAIQDIGWRVPDDVIVAGVDDVEIARMTRPTLTTVRQPCSALAQAAFDMLQWRILNPKSIARKVYLGVQLVERVSTGKNNQRQGMAERCLRMSSVRRAQEK